MRQKRAKSYRKQLAYLQLNFKFREPYQILIDSQLVLDAVRTKLDLIKALERTVQGKIKPMITQCAMEALYIEGNQSAIELAKSFERRKCGHFPTASVTEKSKKSGEKKKEEEEEEKEESDSDDSDDESSSETESEPKKDDKKSKKNDNQTTKQNSNDDDLHSGTKTPSACMWTVVAVDKTINKHRYVVASQDYRLRARLRTIPAVPLIYLNRSVMVMEPMSEATTQARNQIETAKLMRGLTAETAAQVLGKRKADGDASGDAKKKKKAKGPHPLSMLKKKKKPKSKSESKESNEDEGQTNEKKKRRRKHHNKSKPAENDTAGDGDEN